MIRLFPKIKVIVFGVTKNFHGSNSQFRRVIRYPPFLGSSVIVGTYLCFLWLTDNEQPPKFYPDHLSATLVRRLPLNSVSRLMCWVSERQVPEFLRPTVYGSYARVFGCDLNELKESDLKAYRSVSEFFTRELAPGSRPIDPKAELVSPADGQILHFGPIDSDQQILEQVKGVNYSLPEFLGPPEACLVETADRKPDMVWPTVGASKSKNRRLYQCVIYLAPGDCHRFYNPADWKASIRRHFPGKLLSVRPSLVARVPGLYTINERVVYLGQWAHGFMSFTAVGSVGVGGISVPADPALVTNARADQCLRVRALGSSAPMSYTQVEMPGGGLSLPKGQEFGRFRFGSTIVLVFEAPAGRVSWPIQVGQHVKTGQALIRFH